MKPGNKRAAQIRNDDFRDFGAVEIWCKSAGISQNRLQIPAIPENINSWPPYPQKHPLWPLTLFSQVRRVSNQREAFSTETSRGGQPWRPRAEARRARYQSLRNAPNRE
jgi:hypothetical protein